MNWKSYEETVKDIYDQLGKDSKIRIICWGSSCKVEGKSGTKHQIDVLTNHIVEPHEYKTAIECKYWNVKVDKDPITKLGYIINDAQIQRGVIVTKCGFTPDALKVAEDLNISLVELRKPKNEDWGERIKDFHVNIEMISPRFFEVSIFTEDAEVAKENIGDYLSTEIIICSPKEKPYSLSDIFMRKLKMSEETQDNSLSFPDRTVLRLPNKKNIVIKGINYKSKVEIMKSRVDIKGEEYVSYFMHSIFEDKKYFISPDGKPHALD